MKKFKITIPNFLGGFAPGWSRNDYPSYGNANMAGKMQNVDLTDPAGITQGPGLVALTNGTTAGVVNTRINSMLETPVAANTSYGGGGAYIYKLTSASVVDTTAAPESPHGISGTGVAMGDLAYYKDCVYYAYNVSGPSANIGRLTGTTYDDDWASVSGSASISAGGPLPMEVGGNDFMYLGNLNRVSDYDGTTWTNDALDLPKNAEVMDLKWNNNRLYIAANRPDLNLIAAHNTLASIYVWDGVSDSWEDEIRISGLAGGMFVNNGIVYLFYRDATDSSGYRLGYVNGNQIQTLCTFSGSLPYYYQVSSYKNFIVWPSDGKIYAFGAVSKDLPAMLFQLCDGGLTTVGGVAAPFGTLYIGSTQDTSYQLSKLSGYEKSAHWKSLMFPIGKATLEKMKVYFDSLSSGAQVDFTVTTDRGKSSYSTNGMTISHANDSSLRVKDMKLGIPIENDFRVEMDWSNGSTANPVRVNRVDIIGTLNED